MTETPTNHLQLWLAKEDSACSAARTQRLKWLEQFELGDDPVGFPGGWLVVSLFEEAKYCFVYGQSIATVVLGMAFVERLLAAYYYTTGRSDLERASITVLLKTARDDGWLTDGMYRQLDEIRGKRNPLVHFRAPLGADTVELRAVLSCSHAYEVIEQDARNVLTVLFHLIRTPAFVL